MTADGIDGMERFESPGKGRGLRVTRAYRVGELLFVCPAYSHVLSVSERGYTCEHCFARKEGLSKCGKCKKAFYCNVECQRGDWAMHKLECSAMCSFGESWCPSETVRLVARIITRMQKVQKERSDSEKLLLLKDLEGNLDKLDNEKREMNEADIAELHHFYSKHLDFPDHQALLTLFAQVHCNGFTVEDEELSHVGSAVFPDVALMNHSCCPNVIVTYRGTSAEVRAVKDISPAMEVYTSYIDLLYPTEDRMERLRDSYYFTCDCKECKTKSKDKVKLKLRKVNGDEPRSEEIREMLRYARNAIEDFRRAKQEKTPAELLEICELSMDKMGSMFEDSNVYMLHMMYQAMGVCMYMEDYDGAVSYGEKVIKPFRQLYPAYSLNVASMYLKLGRLYTVLDRLSAGSAALKKALAIMEVVHGKDHVYVKELQKQISTHQK
ncbi:N-lysine methyltransferase SMYD2-B isoform X2 [Ictalurus furcatus]|uniref:N-lysine methyltransferase SMYD2-B isoform X2 n=1 Tax=Ictalurus furcatus TaxID=66913 RepID=UPI0023501AB7|nr:N-lysine methyltransferase SMYD2-B isoform X2 [Ictalurus furcatus]